MLLRASSKQTPCYAKVTAKIMAPRPGFEPGLEDSKSSVLPLDDLGTEPRFKDIFPLGRVRSVLTLRISRGDFVHSRD